MNVLKKIQTAFIGIAMLFLWLPATGMAATNSLVNVHWLASNLHKKDVVILDVSTFTNYEKSHIPGAVKAFGPWQIMNETFVGFMMPTVNDLQEMIRSYGVNSNTRIVLYDEGITVADTAKSARALWTLHALGHTKVAILDGGFAAWNLDEMAVSNKAATPSRGNFSASYQQNKIADMAEVKSQIGSTVMVDCRVPDEHFGHEKKSHVKRFGHLPHSMLWPATYLTDAGVELSPSYFKDTKNLATMAAGVGIPKNKKTEVILYSNHGLSAALDYFVLHDILGYSNVKLFDGSILEAAADSSVPMEQDKWGYKKL